MLCHINGLGYNICGSFAAVLTMHRRQVCTLTIHKLKHVLNGAQEG